MAVGAASPRTASCRRRSRPHHLEYWTRRRPAADHRVDADAARAGAGPWSIAAGGEASTSEVADPEKHAPKDATRANQSLAGCLNSCRFAQRRVAPDQGPTEEGQDPSPQSPSKSSGPGPANGAATPDARSIR